MGVIFTILRERNHYVFGPGRVQVCTNVEIIHCNPASSGRQLLLMSHFVCLLGKKSQLGNRQTSANSPSKSPGGELVCWVQPHCNGCVDIKVTVEERTPSRMIISPFRSVGDHKVCTWGHSRL